MSAPGTPRRNGKATRKVPNTRDSPLSARGLVPSAKVVLLYAESDSRSCVKVGTAELFGTMAGELATTVHNHDVRKFQSAEHDVVLVWKAKWEPGKEDLVYPYKMPDNDEQPAPKCLGDMVPGCRYAWDVDMMEAPGHSGTRSTTATTSMAAAKLQSEAPPVDSAPSVRKRTGSPPPLQLAPPTKSSRVDKGSGLKQRKETLPPAAVEEDEISPVVPATTPGRDPDVEMDITVPAQLSVPDVDLSRYRKKSVLVNVNNISFMEHTVRDTESQHVKALEKAIGERGSLSSAGFLTVTVMDAAKLESIATHIDKENRLLVQATGVDGRHRTLAYRSLQAKASSDDKRNEFTWVWAQLYTREDGKPMSDLEVISVGAHLNDVSSTVRKSTFADNIHNAMSCVALVKKHLNVSVEDIEPAMVAKVMASIRSIPGLSRTQYGKYARVAHAFTRHDIKASVLKEYPNLGVVHISNPEFLKLDRDGIKLGLEAVSAYVKAPPPRGGSKGSFDDAGDAFYDSLREMYAQARASARHYAVPVTQLLDEDVAITSTTTKKVREIIRNSLSSFTKKESDSERTQQKGRMTKLRRHIETHYDSIARRVSASTVSNPVADHTRRSERSTAGKPPQRIEVESFRRPLAKKKPRHVPRQLVGSSSRKDSPPARGGDGSDSSPRTPAPRDRTGTAPGETTPKSTPVKQKRLQESGASARPGSGDVYEFDDDIPSLNPAGYSDPPEWKGEERPHWVAFASVLPSKWPRSNPIQHVSPWLHAMHIPPQHRAHVMCKPDELLAIHRAVYYHAAKERHREVGSTLRPVIDNVKLPRSPMLGFLGPKHTPTGALWAAAYDRDELALEYFGRQRGLLDTMGYCILEGFTNDENIPPRLAFPRCDTEGDVIGMLADYFAHSFPGEEALRDEGNRTLWNPIINTTSDDADRAKGVGRFITTLEGVAVHLEQNVDLLWVVRKRALLDVRLCQIAVAMGLDKDDATRNGLDLMAIPKTGGRFLLTGKGCQRQYLHTDFGLEHPVSDTRNPGYFVLCTTRSPTPLWVVNHSHFYLREDGELLRALAKGTYARKVMIQPFSVLIGRGDLFHGGAGHDDFPNPTIRGCLRYHMYFVPHDRTLVDGIHLVEDFAPGYEDDIKAPTTPQRARSGQKRVSVERPVRTRGRVSRKLRELSDSSSSSDSDDSKKSSGESASSDSEYV